MFWITLVASFLGGGIAAAIITAVFNRLNEKEQERRRFRENQIQFLYGPLYYWVSNSEKLFELNTRILKAYGEEFSKYSKSDTETRKTVAKEATKTIDIANEYVARVRENNKKMLEILEKYYSYIEVNDIEIFKLFYEHYIRMETEINEKHETETPFGIYQLVGDISHLRPEVMQRVKEVFLSKKHDLEKHYDGRTAISKGGSMQLKTKKVIAREWLIILGILIISGLFIIVGENAGKKFEEHQKIKPPKGFVLDTPTIQENKPFDPDAYLAERKGIIQPPNRKVIFLVNFFGFLKNLGYFLLIFAYPFYWLGRFTIWLGRFTIWAVRTLKQVEPQK